MSETQAPEPTGFPVQNLTAVGKGLLGFESLRQFVLKAYDPATPFYWFSAVEQPEVAFLVMEPELLVGDYSFDLPDEEATALQLQQAEQAHILVLLTVPEDPLQMTANLLGPLIINRNNHTFLQLVLDKANYPVRFPVFAELEA